MHKHHDGSESRHDHGDLGRHHEHAHRGGILGWLQHTFAHSHDVHDKVDDVMESHERGFWATKWALVSLGITTVIQLAIVFSSGSAALFADTIHNLGDGLNSIPLLLAFWLQRRVHSRSYSYGMGRTEDLAGIVIVLSIAVSAGIAGYESVRKLLDPEPMSHLWWVALAALVGFAGNEAVAWLQIRTGNQIGSAALVADGKHALIDGLTSLAVLIAVGGVLVGLPILDPLIGLAITATILVILKGASVAVFRRLLDGIEPEILAQVEHAPLHVEGVQSVHEARARWLGHKVRAELHLIVDRTLSVEESHRIVERVERALAEHVPAFGGAIIHVCPCNHPDRPAIVPNAVV